MLRTGCADLIEAAGMFRQAHRQAEYMHADRFDVNEKSLQSAPVPYMHRESLRHRQRDNARQTILPEERKPSPGLRRFQ